MFCRVNATNQPSKKQSEELLLTWLTDNKFDYFLNPNHIFNSYNHSFVSLLRLQLNNIHIKLMIDVIYGQSVLLRSRPRLISFSMVLFVFLLLLTVSAVRRVFRESILTHCFCQLLLLLTTYIGNIYLNEADVNFSLNIHVGIFYLELYD